MGILHQKRKLSENQLGAMYECLFPEYIVRFTIYSNSIQRVECWFWKNDGYNNREGTGECLRAFLGAKNKVKTAKQETQPVTKVGKGYDTFEEANEAWTVYYNSLTTKENGDAKT